MRRLRNLFVSGALATLFATALFIGSSPDAFAGASHAKNPCNPCSKGAVRFTVDDPMMRNTVTFTSEAPLEDIIGTSNQIRGWIEFDPMHPDKGGRGEFMVPVASLGTGIPLRDEHLQSAQWLDAGAHPEITLTIDKVTKVESVKKSRDFHTFEMTAHGSFSLHGKTKKVRFPIKLTYLPESDKTKQKMPGDLLAAKGSFMVALSDFGITGPPGMDLVGNKVGREITVDVSLFASNASMSAAANPCNPCGDKAANPCNPCGGNKVRKASNPCNPCGGK